MKPIILLRPQDQIILRKPHPCGGNRFRIIRVGAQVRILCETCGRDMTVERLKLEKSIRSVLPADSPKEEL